MNNDMKIGQIDQTHRIRSFKKDDVNRKFLPTIVKFVPIDVTFLSIKKVLKGKNIQITESFTKEIMSKL